MLVGRFMRYRKSAASDSRMKKEQHKCASVKGWEWTCLTVSSAVTTSTPRSPPQHHPALPVGNVGMILTKGHLRGTMKYRVSPGTPQGWCKPWKLATLGHSTTPNPHPLTPNPPCAGWSPCACGSGGAQ